MGCLVWCYLFYVGVGIVVGVDIGVVSVCVVFVDFVGFVIV